MFIAATHNHNLKELDPQMDPPSFIEVRGGLNICRTYLDPNQHPEIKNIKNLGQLFWAVKSAVEKDGWRYWDSNKKC